MIGVLSIGAFTLGLGQAAEAAVYRYNVINKSSQANVIGGEFTRCNITTTGGTCTIAKGEDVTRTIEVSLGASRADVSAGLSISSAASVSTSTSCTSPPLNAGQTWKARAMGTRYTYRIEKQQGSHPRIGGPMTWRTIETSGSKSAFDPSRSAISCGL